MKLSVVILARNEEENIKRCLNSLTFCNEIIVVDDNSTDKTRQIAKDFGARVLKRSLKGDFASQRNFGLKKAKHDWVFFIDADEVVSPSLRDEMLKMTKEQLDKYSGFYLKRRDIFLGKELKFGETGSMKLVRLGRKDCGVWKRSVHEYWHIEGKLGEMKNPIIHYSHPNLAQLIKAINKWSRLHAVENIAEGKKSNLLKIIIFPLAHFFKNYFLRRGYKDGIYGFVFAVLMSFHSFLAWSESWLRKRKSKNI